MYDGDDDYQRKAGDFGINNVQSFPQLGYRKITIGCFLGSFSLCTCCSTLVIEWSDTSDASG